MSSDARNASRRKRENGKRMKERVCLCCGVQKILKIDPATKDWSISTEAVRA